MFWKKEKIPEKDHIDIPLEHVIMCSPEKWSEEYTKFRRDILSANSGDDWYYVVINIAHDRDTHYISLRKEIVWDD